MGTIGLAHRAHRDFVVDWLEPELSPTELEEGLAERVEMARTRARAVDAEELARTPGGTPPADEPHEPHEPHELETWLAGEPTF
jgi:hypothetical protein